MHTSLHAYVCMYVYIYIHTCIYLCIVSVVLTTTDCTRYWWEIGFMGLCIGFVHWYFQVVVRALQEGFGEYMMVHSYSGSLGSLKNSIDYFFSFYLFFFPPPPPGCLESSWRSASSPNPPRPVATSWEMHGLIRLGFGSIGLGRVGGVVSRLPHRLLWSLM